MVRLCLALLILSFASPALSATFYVAQAGTATKADATSASTPMSPSTHNAAAFAAGDVIYLLDTITSRLTMTSGGATGNHIVYRGDYPSRTCLLQPASMATTSGAAVDFNGQSHITFYNESTRAVMDGQITSGTIDEHIAAGRDNYNLIDIDGATNLTFDNWEFRRSYNVVRSAAGCTDIIFRRCKFSQNRMRALALSGGSTGFNRITIGGSEADGNEFDRNTYKLVHGTTNSVGGEIYLYQGANFIISHNEIHGTKGGTRADGWSQIGIACYGASNGLIESNTIYDFGAKNFRGAMHFKGLSASWTNHNTIVRRNHIYNMPLDPDWVYVSGASIILTRDTYNFRIYHNRIHSAIRGVAMDINGEAVSGDGMNDIHVEDIYIWGNTMSGLLRGAFSFADGYSGNTDDYDDIYFINNSTSTSLSNLCAPALYGAFNYGTGTDGTDDTGLPPHVHVKNNIFSNSMHGCSPQYFFHSVETADGNWLNLDFNLLHVDGDTPAIRYGATVLDWNSASLPSAWNERSVIGNPLYLDAPAGDLRLATGSPAIGAGDDVGSIAIPSMSIPYCSEATMAFSFDTILGPATDWSTTPATIVAVDQAGLFGHVIGAYAYDEPATDAGAAGGPSGAGGGGAAAGGSDAAGPSGGAAATGSDGGEAGCGCQVGAASARGVWAMGLSLVVVFGRWRRRGKVACAVSGGASLDRHVPRSARRL